MPTLTPVDQDPFAPQSQSPNLTPVDHDPFAPAAPSAGQSPNDLMLQHMASWLPGAATLQNVTRAATDWPTLGLGDKLIGVFGDSKTQAQAQADTVAAHKSLGNWDIPVSLAGSAVSALPELKAASALGETMAPGVGNLLGGVLGSGAVGAGTSALGAYGHEQGWTPNMSDIGRQAAIGGGVGALLAGHTR